MGRQRVAGATVEEAIFDDINAWQAQVSKKPPLEEPRTWQGQCLGGETRDGKATRGRSNCGRKPSMMTVNAWQAQVLDGNAPCSRNLHVAGPAVMAEATRGRNCGRHPFLTDSQRVAGAGLEETTRRGT